MGTDAADVLALLTLLGLDDEPHWVEGGWGIDALLGQQTRDHGDLDLMIDRSCAERTQGHLRRAGFEIVYADLPGTVSYVDANGREVDLCVTGADRYGDRWNLSRSVGRGEPDYPFDGFTYGWIGGRRVPCLGPQLQMEHHLGYEAEEVDRWDVEHLRSRFAVVVPLALR
jgi:lincosamide nucleotidyltransferase A/C/D/E